MDTIDRPTPRDGWQLLLLGYLTLFLELTLIRFLPASVWNLGFFPNFVLISVFVGLGVGFVFHTLATPRRSQSLFQIAAVTVFGLIVLVTQFRPSVPGFGRDKGQVGEELFFSAAETSGSGAMYVFPILFPLIAIIFALIAQRTAKVFARFRPLTAYTLDIAGSCLGIVSFIAVSYFQVPAWAWFVALVPMFVLAAAHIADRLNLIVVGTLAISAFLVWQQDGQLLYSREPAKPEAVAWSPYQKVECALQAQDRTPFLFVNGIMHQKMQRRSTLVQEYYQKPHDRRKAMGLPPYRRVLVLGAGSGNDLAAALANGAEHIDAVEIDPVIAEFGKKYHPLRPYDDQRISLIVDDGRAVLSRAKGPYDLIIFAVTDSLVKISPMAQLRLENYLFTEESVRKAYDLLAEDGDMVFYNWYREDWLVDKIKLMIQSATGRLPAHQFQVGSFAGLITPKMASVANDGSVLPPVNDDMPRASDDWPFLYLRERSIAPVYQSAMIGLVIIVTALLAILHWFDRRNDPTPIGAGGVLLRTGFLLMGTAFLLLETKGVIQFSLLFGTTWLNNSLVFLAVLVSVLVANWTATIIRSRRALPVLFVLLLASCLVTLVWPLANLLAIEDRATRFALASLMTFSPIFFANLIFSVTFRDQPSAERLFGWNLLGATLGGVLEYSSMILGYNALAVLVALIYTLVFVALTLAPSWPSPQNREAPVASN